MLLYIISKYESTAKRSGAFCFNDPDEHRPLLPALDHNKIKAWWENTWCMNGRGGCLSRRLLGEVGGDFVWRGRRIRSIGPVTGEGLEKRCWTRTEESAKSARKEVDTRRLQLFIM